MQEMEPFFRGRRLRRSAGLRALFQETRLHPSDLIMPYFVVEAEPGATYKKEISAMPGQYHYSITSLVEQVGQAVKAGLKAIILFGVLDEKAKDSTGKNAYAENGIVQQALRALRPAFPDLVLITDVCLCEYTSHGHCGLIEQEGRLGAPKGHVLNDPTLELLGRVAVSHAKAGADMVAPSDMMDGRVLAIRNALDDAGFNELPILSYAVKYSGAFYGPFREAAGSAPSFGDRKTYQMDPANATEAIRELDADIAQGADAAIIKPAGPYLDIIRRMYDTFPIPLVAYQVSGEYSMIKAAGMQGWIDEKAVALESLLGMKRAGATAIITYFTEDILKNMWLS